MVELQFWTLKLLPTFHPHIQAYTRCLWRVCHYSQAHRGSYLSWGIERGLRDPIDGSLPGSSVHGIFQARVLEWGAIAFSVVNLTQPLTSESPSLVSVWLTTRLTSQEADEIGGSKILPSGKGFWSHSVLSRSCTGVGTMTLVIWWRYGDQS